MLPLVAGPACAAEDGGRPSPTALAATATPAAPPATPTPDASVLLAEGGIAIIEQAALYLLNEYIDPLDSAAVLGAGWAGVQAEASNLALDAPPAPAFGGGFEADFAAFRSAYVPLARGLTDATDLRYAAIRGMAQSLSDCHTFFLTPVASTTLSDQRAGVGVVGIGVELASVPPLVTEVIEGSPAARAGVVIGDRIAEIDGADATAFGPASAYERINGSEGTSVNVKFRRPAQAGLLDLTLRRERVDPPNISTRLIGDSTGYLRIRTWLDGGVKDDLAAKLADFERQGIDDWIIDLRDNPGGQLDLPAISLFVRDGVVVRSRGRDGVTEERANGAALPAVRPIVVLTNNRTGSVSELFAVALQEYGLATILGAQTNGCAGYTVVHPLGDGSSLAVTTHENLGPLTDRPLEGVGVLPNVAVPRTPADIEAGLDPQLDAAIGFINGQ
jgi:carboxyl-terminal processing protease